jgi:hypothetical protein
VLPGFNTVTPTRVQLVSLSYLNVLSNTKVNEARFGCNRFKESFFPQDSSFDPRSIGLNTGITGSQDFGLPFIRIRNDPQLGSVIASIGSTLPITVTPDVGIGNPFLVGGGPRNIQVALKPIF